MSRIVHVNADINGNGGAELAMRLLVDEERRAGHEVLVVSRAQIGWRYRILHLVARAAMKVVWRRCYSGGFLPTGLAKTVNAYSPDVVYLHRLQHGTIGMGELGMINAEIHWIMHDCWPINGFSPFFDEALLVSPVPKSARYFARLAKAQKQKIISSIKDRLTIEVASEWMKRQVLDFMLGERVNVCVRTLPLRKCFSVPRGNNDANSPKRCFTVLFGAANDVWGKVKGFDRLALAMEHLPVEVRHDVELRIFGAETSAHNISGVKTVCLGSLNGESLAEEFRNAGVLALTSRQETYSLTKHEALACGCPVVAFRETACAEGIVDGENGFSAAPDDIRGFADGILHIFNRWREENSRR